MKAQKRSFRYLLAGVLIALAGFAMAQEYPSRMVRIIVAFPPGGSTDIYARLIANELQVAWGKSVIVENRPGGTGVIGTQAVRQSPPDGYTLLHVDIYRKALRCFHAGLERRYPNIERVDVPYETAALPAYFMKAPGAAGRTPTVVVFDGLDNCKEMSVIFAGLEFAKRGFNTLAIDGPGQGEALRLRQIHSRHDYEIAGTAAYEYVVSRPDVDPNGWR